MRLLAIVLGNPTKWGPQAEAYVKGITEENGAQVIMLAETHVAADKVRAVSEKLRALGWSAFIAPAALSGKSIDGTSGGAMLLIRRHLEVSSLGVPNTATDPESKVRTFSQGTDWVAAELTIRGTRIAFMTAYLTCGIGMTGANVEQLSEIIAYMRIAGVPILIEADWNIEPQQLIEWCLNNDLVYITASDLTATCSSGRMIDYFVCSRTVASLVKSTWGRLDMPWGTHTGSTMTIAANPKSLPSRRLVLPT